MRLPAKTSAIVIDQKPGPDRDGRTSPHQAAQRVARLLETKRIDHHRGSHTDAHAEGRDSEHRTPSGDELPFAQRRVSAGVSSVGSTDVDAPPETSTHVLGIPNAKGWA